MCMVKVVRGLNTTKRMSWDKFTRIFKQMFFPQMPIKHFEEEFLRLEQGDMTVREYTNKNQRIYLVVTRST